MSRLGDMIKKERESRKLSPRDAARACGVAEGYLSEVESGRRIINDAEAARILRRMGAVQPQGDMGEANWLDEAPAAPKTPERPAAKPASPPARKDEGPADAWLDALGGVMRRVPVLDAGGRTLEYRPMPVMGGLIEGAPADKVFYYRMPDDALLGYRLRAGDLLFCVPVAAPPEEATLVFSLKGQTLCRRVQKLEGNRLLVQTLDARPASQTLALRDVTILGRAVRAEILLQ